MLQFQVHGLLFIVNLSILMFVDIRQSIIFITIIM